MTFITRAESGLRAPDRTIYTALPAQRIGLLGHHGASASPRDRAGEIRLLLQYQAQHQANGWGDIGYNLAVGPITGDVYEARGLDKVGAHAAGANTPNYGVVLLGDGRRDFTDAAKSGFQEAYRICAEDAERQLRHGVHSDVNATACPTDPVRDWIRAGGLSAIAHLPAFPVAAPAGAPEVERRLTVDGIRGPLTTRRKQSWLGVTADANFGTVSTRAEQTLLARLGYDLGSWGVDGDRGPYTRRAWQSFLRDHSSYRGAIDGHEGPATIRAEQEFLNAQLASKGTAVAFTAPAAPAPAPAPKPAPAPATSTRPTIRRGSTGQAVKDVQARLNRDYPLYSRLAVDGIFGPATDAVVREFQRRAGITVDGIVGPQTYGALGL